MLAPRALVLAAMLALPSSVSAACSSFSTRYNQNIAGVCVCTAASCDEVSNDYLTLAADKVGVFQTSKAGDRLAYSTLPLDSAANATASSAVEISLDSSVTYQKITGFGGAFTDSTALNVYKLSPELQEKLLTAYFGDKGIQYTIGRVPIGSTDFSESIYSYNPVDGDLDMVNFSIEIDKNSTTNKLAFIKRALAKSSRSLPLFASSWAPPAWMTREKKVQNSHIIGEPGEPYWKALALYYSRFLDEYKKEGVNFWAMTTQNEPNEQFNFLVWQQLRFNSTQERDFIKLDLGPQLKKTHPEVKIIMMDDQKDLLPTWTAALDDPESRKYVSGIGVHWYKNLDFIDDDLGNFQQLADFHAKYPDIFILPSEACSGSMPAVIGTGAGVRILEPEIIWKRGENYARDIINDLANYAVGWTDWNMVLDTKGGPSWVGNFVDSPIIIDEQSGAEFYKQPMYYVMGHFAKFLPAGSTRISLAVSNANAVSGVDRVAFLTPSGQIVAIFSNRKTTPVQLKLKDVKGSRSASLTLPANTVQTVIFASPNAQTPAPTTPAPTTPAPTTPAPTTPAPTSPSTTTPAPTTPAPTTPSPTTPAVTTPAPTTPAVTTPCPLPTPTEPAPTTPAPTTQRPAC